MKIRRKTNACPNCGAQLDKVYNYCPMCGQENTSNYVSLKTLLGDFFNTYFALDSKFANTVPPFFFRPGYLTNKYSEGKRASYTHPLRLYLILSLFFFFVFKKMANSDDFLTGYNNNDSDEIVEYYTSLKNIEGLDKDTKKALKDNLTKKDLKSILKDMNGSEGQNVFQNSLKRILSDQKKDNLKASLDEDILYEIGLISYDSLSEDLKLQLKSDSLSASTRLKDSLSNDESEAKSDRFIMKRLDWKLIDSLKHESQYSDEQLLDSMKLGELSTTDRIIAIQTIRLKRDPEDAFDYILSNLPIMMLILVPIFAAMLKLFYIRRKHLYIKHLIHALNLHSFVYFLYGITLLSLFWLDLSEESTALICLITFIIAGIYAYISFIKVYKQGWFKTLLKFMLVGWVYFSFISFFMLSEALISLLLF